MSAPGGTWTTLGLHRTQGGSRPCRAVWSTLLRRRRSREKRCATVLAELIATGLPDAAHVPCRAVWPTLLRRRSSREKRAAAAGAGRRSAPRDLEVRDRHAEAALGLLDEAVLEVV